MEQDISQGYTGTKRQKITPADVMRVVDKRGKPEVHVHCAVTFVWGGDPLAITAEDRDQMEIELGQFASRMRHGNIRTVDLEQVFKEFRQVVEKRLRDTGTLASGQ